MFVRRLNLQVGIKTSVANDGALWKIIRDHPLTLDSLKHLEGCVDERASLRTEREAKRNTKRTGRMEERKEKFVSCITLPTTLQLPRRNA